MVYACLKPKLSQLSLRKLLNISGFNGFTTSSATFLAQHRPLGARWVLALATNGADRLGRTQAQHEIVLGVAGEENGGHRMFAWRRWRSFWLIVRLYYVIMIYNDYNGQ